MTPQEAAAAFRAIRQEISPRASIHVYLSESDGSLRCVLQPDGVTGELRVRSQADDWSDLVAETRTAWEAHKAAHRESTIREMALEIIRATAEHGACTDNMLRMKFSDEDVRRYSDDACADADEIASNGPFSVEMTEARSNAA